MSCYAKHVGCLLAVCLVLFSLVPARAEYMIDDFSAPDADNLVVLVIDLNDLDPSLVETPLGTPIGERDILVDVAGTARSTSFVGEIGAGTFVFGGSSPGTAATIQYDGMDADTAGPPAELVNSQGLGEMDLTAYGSAFGLDFLSIDGGQAQLTDIEIEVHAPTATPNKYAMSLFVGQIPDSAGPTTYVAPFADFLGDWESVLANASSIEFRINLYGAPDVDFELDAIRIVPEPSTLVLCGLGLVCLLAYARRRRK